ncbi:precorrin-3B synthase [Bosea robiniae]|uniref:Precorrin-3B synthase n=1 Tax=Bosea robiniae TaxID=1036780 RepID=A0ABY0P289_9HYPH|nr:precorrin-3B synthase [Bosea robiniae]SDG79918.1 precorrin-3B synthase [Bosea robiniae]
MNALPKEALRRGWCPSTLRPMETGDGWLVRLHPPGAKLTPAQLRRIAALAGEHGNGLIEISARANLQIRGVTAESHPRLVERLLAEQLVDEHEGDGPHRVTLVSPLAGRDPNGLIDAAALAAQIEQCTRTVPGLPAKLGIVVDDGGAQALDGFSSDIRLVGVGATSAALCLADRLWLGAIPVTEAADAVAAILRDFAARRAAAPDHIRRLRDLSPEALASLTTLPETTAPASRPPPRRAGLFALEGDRFAALIGLPFGRCGAAVLDRLGAGDGLVSDIRLSPWRGLAFRDLGRTEAKAQLALADDLGLITRDDDPRLSVQACAGSPACSRAEAPAMADAATLAEAAADLLAAGATLHVSGCIKACAHPAAADLTLVGRDGHYDVVLGGTTRDKPVATLDLSALLTRLQPGQDIHARLAKALRSTGSQG